jgi:hypothetical protein
MTGLILKLHLPGKRSSFATGAVVIVVDMRTSPFSPDKPIALVRRNHIFTAAACFPRSARPDTNIGNTATSTIQLLGRINLFYFV